MHAYHAKCRRRLACLAVVAAGLVVGCNGNAPGSGSNSPADANPGARRKEMEDFMKGQRPASAPKSAPRKTP